MTGPDSKDQRPQGTDPQGEPRPVSETVIDDAVPPPARTHATDRIEEAEVVSVTPPQDAVAGTGDGPGTADAAERPDAEKPAESGMSQDAAPDDTHAPPAADEPAAEVRGDDVPEPQAAEPAQPDPAEAATAADAQPAPVAPSSARAAEPPPRKGGSGFVALLLGGAIAAGAGFALARFVPEGWPVMQPAGDTVLAGRIDALSSDVSRLADRLSAVEAQGSGAAQDTAALGAEIEALRAAVADLRASATAPPGDAAGDGTGTAALASEIEALRAEVAALRAGGGEAPDVSALAAEVAALRAQVAAGPDAAMAEQIAALTAAAEAERAAAAARAEALRLEAERATAATRARAAVVRLQAAVDGGAPLDAAIADLRTAGIAVPPALAAQSAGVPTLATLQAAFPEAARAALAASATVPPEGGLGERLGAFLRAQTGARSLAPRDGDDPDAVLSRAEAALRAGDLAAVSAELDRLPETAAPALAGWRVQAAARAAAVTAAAELAASLDGE